MRKLQMVLCSAIFSTVLSGCASSDPAESTQQEAAPISEVSAPDNAAMEAPAVVAAAEDNVEQPSQQASEPAFDPNDPYKVTTFTADFKQFTLGDIVPDLYRTKQYEITNWKVRHLPAPSTGTHWTYMGGNYVLISNDAGKILDAKSGDIYY